VSRYAHAQDPGPVRGLESDVPATGDIEIVLHMPLAVALVQPRAMTNQLANPSKERRRKVPSGATPTR